MEMNIRGIKCDNPGCGFHDDSVELGEYEKWVNKPCPKCGANLLTQADYDAVMALTNIAFASGVKIIHDTRPLKKGEFAVGVEMHGTGEMSFKVKQG